VARHLAAHITHPALQIVHESGDPLLPHGATLVSRQTIDGALSIEDRIDPADSFDRQRRLREFRQLEEVAPAVRPTQRLDQRVRLSCLGVQIVEPSVGIRLQDPAISNEMTLRVLATPVARVVEDRRRRRRSAERSVVADIGPQPPGDRLASGQHGHGGVIAMQTVRCHDVRPDQSEQRRQGRRAGADPIRQRGDVEIDTFTRVSLALTVQRQMVRELGIQQHRQQIRPSTAT
jgi:hypothetical protein